MKIETVRNLCRNFTLSGKKYFKALGENILVSILNV